MLRLAVLGSPIAHSLSPAMHRYALSSLGLEGSYEALETPLEVLKDHLEEVRREYRGVNLTIPLKEAALPLLDWVSPEAQAIGAVNTVLSVEGRLLGFNTDAPGFLQALKAGGIPLMGPALILGAGGAGRAVAGALGWPALFLTDVPGVLRNPKDPTTRFPHLTPKEVDDLKAQGILQGGMIPKVEAALNALRAGAPWAAIAQGERGVVAGVLQGERGTRFTL
ncbi:hypothetical protein CSW46_01925 [Thermus scotoductus]|nr:hypothetical protein [Thermus scotoductus]RTH12522.1 hypothetical protein CSW46_01925 [Thermus scotoductus]